MSALKNIFNYEKADISTKCAELLLNLTIYAECNFFAFVIFKSEE